MQTNPIETDSQEPSLMTSVQTNLDEAKSMPGRSQSQDMYDLAAAFVDQYIQATDTQGAQDWIAQNKMLDRIQSNGDLRDCLFLVALVALGKLAQIQVTLTPARLPDAGGAK